MKRALMAALLVAVFGALALAARGEAVRAFDRVVEDEDRFYLPPVSWMRAFSLGYNEAAADMVWVATLVYFGERAVQKVKGAPRASGENAADSARFTVNYLAAATGLDPRFRAAYEDGSRLTLYHRGEISRRTVEMSMELLEKGIANFPDDGGMTFTLGFLQYYELEPFLPKASEERKLARRRGADLIARSASLPGAPPYVSVMSAALMTREGLDDLVVEHLRAMLVKETDPKIRDSLAAQLRRAIGKAAERDIALTSRLEHRWREEMSFAPFDLFLLLEPEAPWSVRGVIDPSSLGEKAETDAGVAEDDGLATTAGN